MHRRFRFPLENAVDEYCISDHQGHSNQGDQAHDLKRFEPRGTIVYGQAKSEIIVRLDQIRKMNDRHGQPEPGEREGRFPERG